MIFLFYETHFRQLKDIKASNRMLEKFTAFLIRIKMRLKSYSMKKNVYKYIAINHYNHCVKMFCSVMLCCSSFLHRTISWEGMKIAVWHINTAWMLSFGICWKTICLRWKEVCLFQKSSNWCFGWIVHLQYRHRPMKMPRDHYISRASATRASIRFKDNIKWEIKETRC